MATIRCILCGKLLTHGELRQLSDSEEFRPLFSLRDKIFLQVDRTLKSYVVHSPGAQAVLIFGNGWHTVPCFSVSEYRQPRKRTIGVLNGKLYWDDFPHSKHHCDDPQCSGLLLTPGEINMLLGITPRQRYPIDRKTRLLVFGRYGKQCARCGVRKRLQLHHRRPVIHGGTNDPDNLVPLCKDCHTHHSGEFTEHIWPDLERIFLESE